MLLARAICRIEFLGFTNWTTRHSSTLRWTPAYFSLGFTGTEVEIQIIDVFGDFVELLKPTRTFDNHVLQVDRDHYPVGFVNIDVFLEPEWLPVPRHDIIDNVEDTADRRRYRCA